MRKRTRMTAAMLLAAMFALAGCGSGSKASQSDTLKLFTWVPFSPAALAKFQQETGIKVDVEQVATNDYSAVLQTRASAKADMDVLELHGGAEFNKYTHAGSIADLGHPSWVDNYIPAAIETVNGKIYGAAQGAYATGVWYNKTLFDKLGIGVPTNWDEFIAVTQKLKASGVAPLVDSGGEGWSTQYIYHNALAGYLAEHPQFTADLASGALQWSQIDPFVRQIQRYESLAKSGAFLKGSASLNYEEAYAAIRAEKAAMWITGDWAIDRFGGSLQGTPPVDFEVGAFPVPYNDAGQPTATADLLVDGILTIPAWSKHKQQAEQFLEFISKPENAAIAADDQKTFSTVKDVKASFSKLAPVWLPLYADAKPYPGDLGEAVTNDGPNLLVGVLAGKTSAADVLKGFDDLQAKDRGKS